MKTKKHPPQKAQTARAKRVKQRLTAQQRLINWLYQGNEQAYHDDILDYGLAAATRHEVPRSTVYRKSSGWWAFWTQRVDELAGDALALGRKLYTLMTHAQCRQYWIEGLRSMDCSFFKPLD